MRKVLKKSWEKERVNRAFVSGFTLVELLIVMAIIAIIALLAIANYSGIQRQARLSYGADGLASMMKEQMLFARSGRVGMTDPNDGSAALQCYAIRFKKGQLVKDNALQGGESDYVGVPSVVNDGNGGSGSGGGSGADFAVIITSSGTGTSADFCSPIEDQDWVNGGFLADDLRLKDVRLVSKREGDNISVDELNVYFKPPYGKAYRYDDSENFVSLSDYFIEVVLNFDDSNFPDKTVRFDPDTGAVEVTSSPQP